jgi:hypothetical protein
VIRGAETTKLGAAVHGAELRVHFLKSFQEGRICKILSQKGPKKNKKVGQSEPSCVFPLARYDEIYYVLKLKVII